MGMFFREIQTLVVKEFKLESRQRHTFNSIALYIFSTVFVCYLSFNQQRISLQPITWNTLFWIILLFAALNAIARSFDRESQGAFYFYYGLASPEAIIFSKIIYNALLMMTTTGLGLVIYWLVLGNPVQDLLLFTGNLLLGAFSFAASLTAVAGIAAKAGNNSTLMAILGFPIVLPQILLLIRVSKNALDGLERRLSYDEVLTIFAIDLIVLTVSYLLFPYLWRSSS